MTPKIVFFNCPPRAGKDLTAEVMLRSRYCLSKNLRPASLKEQLLEVALSAIPDHNLVFQTIYDKDKEVPQRFLNGLSPRQYLTKVSEEWLKPTFGNDYFGKMLRKSIQQDLKDNRHTDAYLVTDGGFGAEIQPLIDYFGTDNVLIIQWGREGSSFQHDSRDYIKDYPDNTVVLEDNNGDIRDHATRVFEAIFREEIDESERENINRLQGE
jgi:hypothetical protein